jgi:hypothetical protein
MDWHVVDEESKSPSTEGQGLFDPKGWRSFLL